MEPEKFGVMRCGDPREYLDSEGDPGEVLVDYCVACQARAQGIPIPPSCQECGRAGDDRTRAGMKCARCAYGGRP